MYVFASTNGEIVKEIITAKQTENINPTIFFPYNIFVSFLTASFSYNCVKFCHVIPEAQDITNVLVVIITSFYLVLLLQVALE